MCHNKNNIFHTTINLFYRNKAVTLFNFYAYEQNELILIYAVHYLIQ